MFCYNVTPFTIKMNICINFYLNKKLFKKRFHRENQFSGGKRSTSFHYILILTEQFNVNEIRVFK